MTILEARELLQFPAGDNATDVLINTVHYNRTALEFFNYTLWSNNTLSNDSACYLVFEQYKPIMFANGTFVNSTSCYEPFYTIQGRGILGIIFSCLFAASIVFSAINLRKHGRLFLPSGKRFRAIGRRWQWYWLLFVGSCGIISGFMSIDVDRAYLQGLAIVLQNFFYFLMTPGILAAVWESVRHWGSWQERQIYDRDSYALGPNGLREKKEFWMPLMFYLFGFMNFFLTVPRSWTQIEYQRSLEQQSSQAKPAGTDGRFKAGAMFAFLAWCVICYSLRHSIYYYKPQNRGLWNRSKGFLHSVPSKFMLVIPLALVVVGYAAAIAFDWSISPLKYNAPPSWIYGLGYGPILLIVIVFEVYGYIDGNEDRLLIAQRRERGRVVDAELGIRKKPGWWSKRHGEEAGVMSAEDRLKAMTSELGGGQPTHRNIQRSLEMGTLPPRTTTAAAQGEEDSPKPSWNNNDDGVAEQEQHDGDDDNRPSVERADSRTSRTSQMQATAIRSMLDV